MCVKHYSVFEGKYIIDTSPSLLSTLFVPLGLFSEVCVLGIESSMGGEPLSSVAFQTDTAP